MRRRSGTARPRRTIRCTTRADGCGGPRASARRPIRTSASRARIIRRRRCSRWRTRRGISSMLDPKTGKITLIRTCYQTHHLIFAEDANNTLWLSAGGPGSGALGWLDTKKFDETGDEAKSQGWTPIVLDTNGNGKRDEWVEPNQPVDPTKDKRIVGALYGIGVNPQDGTIWGSVLTFPGYVIRVDPGPNPSRDRARRNLRTAAAGLRAARLRHRPQRHRLGAALERPHGELRPAASARARSTVRPPRPAGIVRKAGRSIRCPVRRCRALPRPAARRRATTPGSISSTPSGSARTCRGRPATATSR